MQGVKEKGQQQQRGERGRGEGGGGGGRRGREEDDDNKDEDKEISSPESQKIIFIQGKKSQEEEIYRLIGSFQTKKPKTLTQLLPHSCLPGTLSLL